MQSLNCAGKNIDLSIPQVMGILNVTPDSFSDGGLYTSMDAAVNAAQQMCDAGAAFIDIGGESTRPGAQPVSVDEEKRRVIPLIEKLKQQDIGAVISVDTSKPEVMKCAVEAGAGLINDVCALSVPAALETVVQLDVPVCIMHMQGEPRTMQNKPVYNDVVEDVSQYLQQRIDACLAAGISKHNIVIDPGFGFGKTVEQNFSLLKNLKQLSQSGVPVLAGLSRKSMLGAILDKEPMQRLSGSIAAACFAMMNGASILRVHDVAETIDAVKIYTAMTNAGE